MPVAQPGAPKCPPFASLCECNKNHYYCLRIREERGKNSQGEVQAESIGHIQSAGCLGQSEVVTAAHNRCIRDLLRDIQTHTKKSSGLIMLTLESEQTIGKLWEQEECEEICPKQELWEAAKETEMSIPLQKQEDEGPAVEQDYEERFGDEGWMG